MKLINLILLLIRIQIILSKIFNLLELKKKINSFFNYYLLTIYFKYLNYFENYNLEIYFLIYFYFLFSTKIFVLI